MISDVVLVGIANDNLERGFRDFIVESTDGLSGNIKTSILKVRYWSKEPYTRINKIKYGANVVIRGRLETDEEFGLHVVAESIFVCG